MVKAMGLRWRAIFALGAAALVGLGASGCAPNGADGASPPLAAAAAAQLKIRAIKIDVAPLADNGLGPEASWLAQDLPAKLRAAFASRMAPGDAGAATLAVRIDRVTLGESGGGGTDPFGLGGARDNITGVGALIAPDGKTIGSYPLFATQIALTGGPVYEVGTERRRVDELAGMFAYWLPGKMGL